MRGRLVFSLLGALLVFFGLSFMLPLLTGLWLREQDPRDVVLMFGAPMLFSVGGGWLLYQWLHCDEELRDREAFVLVSAAWLLFAAVGALPYLIAEALGLIAYDMGLAGAFFESMSGFTTTGATIFDIHAGDEDGYFLAPKSLLLWRSQTQWLGGMGIIVLATVVFSRLLGGGIQVLRAEMPGTDVTRLRPQMAQTAKLLWGLYAGLTAAEVLLLWLVGRMPLFDAICNSFSTLSTGGFSPQTASIAAYDSGVVEAVIIFFMLVAGINFVLLYRLFYSMRHGDRRTRRGFGHLFASGEFRLYLFFIALAVGLVVLGNWKPVQGGGDSPLGELQPALFQVVSLLTTTGFTTEDYGAWAQASQFVLLMLMFIGSCAGSTGGGMKVIRIEILLRALWRELFQVVHPRAMVRVRVGEEALAETLVRNVAIFFFIFIVLFLTGSLVLLYLEPDWGLIDAMAACIACLSNIGPGLGAVGPGFDYGGLSPATMTALSALMWLGRLEVITGLLLLFPGSYRD